MGDFQGQTVNLPEGISQQITSPLPFQTWEKTTNLWEKPGLFDGEILGIQVSQEFLGFFHQPVYIYMYIRMVNDGS